MFIVASVSASFPAGGVFASPCWEPPVDAPVVDPFREPACRWCPGNRGIEFGTVEGDVVRTVATGEVTYSGVIAGVRYVVVRHGDGRRATYGNLAGLRHGTGDVVVRGTTLGPAAGPFHFGLRKGDDYVDPGPFLGQLVHRARLVPIDGSPGNEAPPPTLRCAATNVVSGSEGQMRPIRW
jgi:murein DD-endopeptidase MepM/ murein hydrolase activator NlpD